MMETKYLWDRIDALRDALKDMKEENDALDSSLKECVNDYEELQKENDHLKLRVEELDDYSDEVDVKRSRAEVENDKLKNGWYVKDLLLHNESLKLVIVDLEKLIDAKHIKRNKDSNLIASLKAENDDLKDEAVKWNRKHNKLQESIINYKKPTFH